MTRPTRSVSSRTRLTAARKRDLPLPIPQSESEGPRRGQYPKLAGFDRSHAPRGNAGLPRRSVGTTTTSSQSKSPRTRRSQAPVCFATAGRPLLARICPVQGMGGLASVKQRDKQNSVAPTPLARREFPAIVRKAVSDASVSGAGAGLRKRGG